MERRAGAGRVLLWTSSLDMQWSDLPVKAVFLPFVHRMVVRLASYTERPAWVTVGEVMQPDLGPDRSAPGRVVLTPSGGRLTIDGEGPEVLEIEEPGFYEIRAQGRDSEAPATVASNVDLAESDLAVMDPQELVAGAIGRAGGAAPAGTNVMPTPEEQERAQRIWWYALFAGLVLLGIEPLVANRQG